MGGSGSGGSVGNVAATIDIKFSGANSVFFNAADVNINSIDDQLTVGKQVMELFQQGKWNKNMVLISNLAVAGSSTIIISGNQNAAISLDASVNGAPSTDLANAKLGLSIKAEKNIGLKIIAEAGIQPLMGLSGVNSKFVFPSGFHYKYSPCAALAEPSASVDAEDIDRNSEEWYFGQVIL
jgi:hypothetical protein